MILTLLLRYVNLAVIVAYLSLWYIALDLTLLSHLKSQSNGNTVNNSTETLYTASVFY